MLSNLKTKFKKHQIILSILAVMIGAYLLVMGLFAVVLTDMSPAAITDMAEAVGNWIYWLFVLGIALVVIFSIYLVDRYRKIKEFHELIDTKSKSKFRKNIARIETLALSLGPEYEDKVMEMEEELGLDH